MAKDSYKGKTSKAALRAGHQTFKANPTKTFAKKVMAVVTKKEETKYAATALPITGVTDSLLVPTGLIPCLPKLAQGPQSNQRVGQKISMAHGKVDFSFFLIPSGVNYPTQDVYVKIFLLRSKQAKSYGQVALLPGATLLDGGNQTSNDWAITVATAIELNQYPLSHEDFAGHIKTIRLIKNQGVPNNDLNPGTAPNTFGHISANYSYRWKHKGSLLYDDTGSNNPTNFAPVFGVVAYNSDNTLFGGLVQYYARQHMWYKDS